MAPKYLSGGKEGSVCSCQVKAYDSDDESTWEKPRYVHLHHANAPCCEPNVYTVDLPEVAIAEAAHATSNESFSPGSKRSSSGRIVGNSNKPIPRSDSTTSILEPQRRNFQTISTSSFYGTSSTNTKSTNRPTLVNGKLVPSRLAALETQVTKGSQKTRVKPPTESTLQSRAQHPTDMDDIEDDTQTDSPNDDDDHIEKPGLNRGGIRSRLDSSPRPKASKTYSRHDRMKYGNGQNRMMQHRRHLELNGQGEEETISKYFAFD